MTQDAPQRQKPHDLDGCHQLIDELFDVVDVFCQDRERITEDRDRILELYNDLRRSMYGQRRERFDDPDQMILFDKKDVEPSSEYGSEHVDVREPLIVGVNTALADKLA